MGNGAPGARTAAYGPASQGSVAGPGATYGPMVQPASWTQKLQAAVTAPFQTTAQAPPPAVDRHDPLQLSQGTGPATPELFVSMAALSERTGDGAQARQLYHQALRLEPQSVDAMLGMARLEDREGRLEAALQWYQNAAVTEPQNAVVANDYGLCLARAGRVDEALAPLAQAVRLDPAKPLYRNNLAKVLVALDRPAEAAAQLAAVHEPARVNYNMAVLLLEQDRIAEAARCLQVATTMDPQFTEANDLLAEMTEGDDVQVAAEDRPRVATRESGPVNLREAITEAAREAQPWPALTAPSGEAITPTQPNAGASAEPVLLPAAD